MRIAHQSRRLLGRARGLDSWTLLQAALIALIALQCARLAWAVLTPVAADGAGEPPASLPSVARHEPLGSFDPIFRLGGAGGPAVVTALNLKLFGVRQDQASGRGSAIIALPDGQQRSFAVGEEVVPGVTLKSVQFDGVTLGRGGIDEQLFMDQSPPATPAGRPAPGPALQAAPAPMAIAPPPTVAPPPPPRVAAADIGFAPRMVGPRMSGVVVRPQGSGEGFRALGLAPGDIVTAVNGRRIDSAAAAQAIAGQIGTGRGLTLQVERDGRVIRLQPGSPR